jgi:type I restriction enzyme M protein
MVAYSHLFCKEIENLCMCRKRLGFVEILRGCANSLLFWRNVRLLRILIGAIRMLTGEIRNKVDKIWTDIWAGGITNPLTVIEQLTYLMFIRSLDEKELENERFEAISGETRPKIFPQDEEGQSMRWSKFKTKDPRIIYDIVTNKVFPFIKAMNGDNSTAFSRFMQDAMFLIPTPQVLQKVITGLDELYEHDIQDQDMQGDLYEYMLSKLTTAGQNGQFRTPKHIRDMMVRLLCPTPNDRICDPACGTAGFLVSSAEYIREKYETRMTPEQWDHFDKEMFTGFDTDRTMLRISAMNLMLHSITHPRVEYMDSVSKQNTISSAYDIILANPPFKGTIDAESISDTLKTVTNTKKTELLFVALFLRMLRKGGRCACIVPDGVLFGSTKAHKALRKELVENHRLQAVISMPSGVFKPYAGVSTAVLVFTKTGAGGTDKVWFYDMQADGFSLDDKRTPIENSDIPDIIERFHNLEAEADRKRTEKSFLVNKPEIVENDYDLSINRYKEIVYEKIEYDPPQVIMDRIDQLNRDIASKMEELRGLIGE